MRRSLKYLATLILASVCIGASAQDEAFSGNYFNKEYNIQLKLNLDTKNIPVPGLEVDSCYGYLRGNINGLWVILKVKNKEDKHAVVRAISERGADAQDLELLSTDEGIYIKQVNSTYIKGIGNQKYIKLPKTILLSK